MTTVEAMTLQGDTLNIRLRKPGGGVHRYTVGPNIDIETAIADLSAALEDMGLPVPSESDFAVVRNKDAELRP